MIKLDDIRDEILKNPEARVAYEEERELLMQEIAEEETKRAGRRQSETAPVSMCV